MLPPGLWVIVLFSLLILMALETQSHSTLILNPVDNQRLAVLCGSCDQNIQQIELSLLVKINHRGNHFSIVGAPEAVQQARATLSSLYQETAEPSFVATPERIHLCLQEHRTLSPNRKSSTKQHTKTLKIGVKARSPNQQHYLDNISRYAINFGIGPAGTGKTYLAVAAAIAALDAEEVQRILLVRPAVEAGERLGFLPGDLTQKVDPYFRPLYDALYEMLGFDRANRLIERHVIEIAPLAYMRGRTLTDAFIILDEGQNTTREQMKMFLTRIGFDSMAVITGDLTQIDLPKNQPSGLQHALTVLKDIEEIGFTHFQIQDVVRHPLVQAIVTAYEKYQPSKSQ